MTTVDANNANQLPVSVLMQLVPEPYTCAHTALRCRKYFNKSAYIRAANGPTFKLQSCIHFSGWNIFLYQMAGVEENRLLNNSNFDLNNDDDKHEQ